MAWIKHIAAAALIFAATTATARTAVAEAECAPGKCEKSECCENRPVTSIYSIEIGGARDLSTYLSPLYYTGMDYAISGSWTKSFNRWSDRCVMRFEAAVNFQDMLNPAKTAVMYGLTARFNWGLSWRHRFARDWQVTVGPMIDLYGGALYLSRNGNNPVTALASAGIDVAASVSRKFRIGRLPVEIVDEVRIPTLSAFFSPEYGETYYEIYLGNHRGLAHCGWWGNAFGIDNLLSFRMNFGRTGMMVGYRFDLRTFRACDLQTQVMRNAFVIGVIPHGF